MRDFHQNQKVKTTPPKVEKSAKLPPKVERALLKMQK
jgi:hypothetical protein